MLLSTFSPPSRNVSIGPFVIPCVSIAALQKSSSVWWGWCGPKMVEESDGETTFSPTNSLKEHLNAEQIPQNNF